MNQYVQARVRAFAFEGPYCYGVGCDHAACRRYTALDGATDDRERIANCGPEKPAYIPEEKSE